MTDEGTYKDGLLAGREEGAKFMRSRIEAYLLQYGVPHPPLPMTLGERKEFEKEWDARVRT